MVGGACTDGFSETEAVIGRTASRRVYVFDDEDLCCGVWKWGCREGKEREVDAISIAILQRQIERGTSIIEKDGENIVCCIIIHIEVLIPFIMGYAGGGWWGSSVKTP